MKSPINDCREFTKIVFVILHTVGFKIEFINTKYAQIDVKLGHVGFLNKHIHKYLTMDGIWKATGKETWVFL